jgi:hypothetical protein
MHDPMTLRGGGPPIPTNVFVFVCCADKNDTWWPMLTNNVDKRMNAKY